MDKEKAVALILWSVIVATMYIFLFNIFTNDKPKTITGYETRTCTIYSDGTETCEVVGRG